MVVQRVPSSPVICSNKNTVFIRLVCYFKNCVLGVSNVSIKILQVDSQDNIFTSCQTVKIVVSKPILAIQIQPFKRFWKTVQPPPSVTMSQNTGMGVRPSGLMVYTPLDVTPSLRSWAQYLIGSVSYLKAGCQKISKNDHHITIISHAAPTLR